jgi:glycosyltransferase involved in cell wall biosynthesis
MNADIKSTSERPLRHFNIITTKKTKGYIGVASFGYGAEKVTYSLRLNNFVYKKIIKLPLWKIFKHNFFVTNTPFVLDNSVRGLHTFNEVPVSTRNFIISYENELPRYLGKTKQWQINFGCELLSSNKCRKILAISNIAAKLAKENFTINGYECINKKITVFRGGIEFSDEPHFEKDTSLPLRILFVGCDAVGKGIVPALNAIEKCITSGINIQLTIVSRLIPINSYILREFTSTTDEVYKKIEGKKYINHIKGAPNKIVRKLMRESDLLIFPSYDESLGYVVIEAGLEGTPAIANNIFAIPELIEDNETGFLIEQELGNQSRWIGIWQDGDELKASIEKANKKIESKIIWLLEAADNNREILLQSGVKMRQKMESMYSMNAAGIYLNNLYQESF